MITDGFKRVAFEDRKIFDKYYQCIQTPFYWHSFVELCTRKWKFYYKEVEDCLVIVKKQFLHQPCLYLVCPPISLVGRSGRELAVMSYMKDIGINTSIPDFYDQFNVAKSMLSERCELLKTSFIEFIYRAIDFKEMMGADFRGLRNEWRQGESVRKDLVFDTEITYETAVKASLLYKNWHATRPKFDYIHVSDTSVLIENKDRLKLTICTTKEGKLVYMSLFEKLNETAWVNIMRCNSLNKDCPVRYSNQWGFVNDMKNIGFKGLVNMGIGGSKGQDAYKRMLHPFIEAILYTTGSKVVSRELYDSFGEDTRRLF